MKLQLLLPFALSPVALALPPANQAFPAVPTGVANVANTSLAASPSEITQEYVSRKIARHNLTTADALSSRHQKCRRGKATLQNKLGTNIFHCEVAKDSIPLVNKTSKKGEFIMMPCGLNNQVSAAPLTALFPHEAARLFDADISNFTVHRGR